MNDPHVIQTNFKVPATCRHEWLLFHGNKCIGAIAGIPGKKQLRAYFRQPYKCSQTVTRLSLDWNAGVVEHLRAICGQ